MRKILVPKWLGIVIHFSSCVCGMYVSMCLHGDQKECLNCPILGHYKSKQRALDGTLIQVIDFGCELCPDDNTNSWEGHKLPIQSCWNGEGIVVYGLNSKEP